MSVILRFPPVNPLRFYTPDLPFPDKWGYPPFGTASQVDSNLRNGIREQYYQKFATADTICIQYHRGRTGDLQAGSNASQLHFKEVGSAASLGYVDVQSFHTSAGVTDEVTGEQLYTEQFLFTPVSLAFLSGKRRIYLELYHYYNTPGAPADTTLVTYRSEPIWLRAAHPFTSLVEYNMPVNDHDVLFEQLRPRFAYRIESSGMSLEPGGDYTSFEDQDRSLVTLDAVSFNSFKWDVGSYEGIPEYMTDIVNRSLQCCKDGYFRIDGREYVWQDGKLDIAGGEARHVQYKTVLLRQKNETDGYTITQRRVDMFTVPSTGYPFAISGCVLSDNFQSLFVQTNDNSCKVFDDEAGLDAWIGAFNTVIVTAGYTGLVDRDGDSVYFTNGETERFGMGIQVMVFNKLLTLTVKPTNTRRYLRYVVSYDTVSSWSAHYHVSCLGASSGAESLHANTTTRDCIVTHEYPSGTWDTGNTVRIFHRDEEVVFEYQSDPAFLSSTKNIAPLTNISGQVSNRLAGFYVYGADFSALTSLSLSFLAPAKDTLSQLQLNRCGIEALTANWAGSLVSGSYKPYWQLGQIELRLNSLSSSEVDAFFNEFWNNAAHLPGGLFRTLNTKGQSPAAPPTISSSPARTGFTNLNWVVVTD